MAIYGRALRQQAAADQEQARRNRLSAREQELLHVREQIGIEEAKLALFAEENGPRVALWTSLLTAKIDLLIDRATELDR